MRLPIKPLIVGFYFYLTMWMSIIPSSAAVSCAEWNTENFFKIAKAEDIWRCLKGGPNKVNARNNFGKTPLHNAAHHNKSPKVATALLEAKARINARDSNGWTPLHYAAKYGNTSAVVKTLLKAGALVNTRDEYGVTPLHRAAGGARENLIALAMLKSFIIRLKTETEALRQGLSAAAAKRKGRLAEAALQKAGRKKAFETTSEGYTAVVTVLLEAGANPNARDKSGQTTLHRAAEYSTPAIITALLKAGADPAAKDEKGKTAWDLAKKNPSLKGTDVYWQLNEARFKVPTPSGQREK